MSRLNKKSRQRQAGVTLTSYALFLAAMVTVSLGAVDALESESSAFLNNTGSQIGAPRPARASQSAQAVSTGSGGGNSGGNNNNNNGNNNTSGFPPGVFPLAAGMPTPVATGGGNFMGTVPAGADLGPHGPWDDDVQSFLFAEKVTVVPPGGLSVNGYFIPGGTTVCTYQHHYSSTPNNPDAQSDPTTYNMGGSILAVAYSGGGLAATSNYGTPDSNNSNGMNGNVFNSNNKDKVIVSGDQQSVTFENYTVSTGADNARIFVDCTPAPPPSVALTTSQANLTNWTPNADGSVTATSNSYGTPGSQEASFNFSVPEDGNYDLFGSVGVGPGGGADNSLWVEVYVDGVLVSGGSQCCGAYQWALPTAPGAYSGFEVDDGTSGAGGINVAPMTLTAGQNVEVVVSNRESGATLFGVELRGV